VLTGFEVWRYTHMEEKWALASMLFDLLSALLRLPARAQLLPAFAADPSLHHVLLTFAGVGHTRLERLHLARQPKGRYLILSTVHITSSHIF
jgi:hypothetical protein